MGEEGGVFVVASAFKSFILKVDIHYLESRHPFFSTFLSKTVGESRQIVFYFLGILSLVKLKENATLERLRSLRVNEEMLPIYKA